MLVSDLIQVGNRLLAFRKKAGLTQSEAAELAGLSDRAYADIERGSTNMRVETLLKICRALNITPNDLLCTQEEAPLSAAQLFAALDSCPESSRQTALRLLDVYLKSLP